jgi:DNA-binding transcriptional LysR family regulator
MAINFRQLEVFRAVAETNSFTRASHAMFISQSTISQHIRALEDTLQVTLFQRDRRNVLLTSAGQNLLDHARDIFQMIERAEVAAKTAKDPYQGKLSFGCASTTLLYQLPPVLMEYTNKYPNVTLNISSGSVQDIANQMWSGALDLGLVVLPLSAPALQKVVLLEESFVGLIPSGHALARKAHLDIGDLAGERYILQRRGHNTRKLVDQFFFKKRIAANVVIELDHPEAVKAMVARGFGASILPESAFPDRRSSAGIRTFPIPHRDLHRALAIVHPRTKAMKPIAAALVDLLEKHFRRPRVSNRQASGTSSHRIKR